MRGGESADRGPGVNEKDTQVTQTHKRHFYVKSASSCYLFMYNKFLDIYSYK